MSASLAQEGFSALWTDAPPRAPGVAKLPAMHAPNATATETAQASAHKQDAALRQWAAAIAARDEQALGAFYDATVSRVYGMALRIMRDPHSAEEVTGDVYFQVWRNAGRYDRSRGAVMAWLLTICRSRALDHLRRGDEADVHPDPHSLVTPDAGEADDSGESLLAGARDHRALHAALNELSPLQRQLVALAFFRGLSHQEISDHAKIPLGSVKSHIRKALKKLREHLPEAMAAGELS